MKILVFIFLGLFGVFSQAQKMSGTETLLISDIDDTIKASHILSPTKYVNSVDISTPFMGMAQLYQLFLNDQNGLGRIIYLSNAPTEIASVPLMPFSHMMFLNKNHFPKGDLVLRMDLRNDQHKNQQIRRLVDFYNPQRVIFIGDNGEKDVEVYQKASNELRLKNIPTLTYIHQLYSWSSKKEKGQKLFEGQIGFVTPFEILIDLNRKKMMSEKSYHWMVENVLPFILKDHSSWIKKSGSTIFPEFKNCSDFDGFDFPDELVTLKYKIDQKCGFQFKNAYNETQL